MSEPPAPPAASHTGASFPCASCGAQLFYAAGQKRLVCPYCGHEQAIPYSEAEREEALTAIPLEEALAARLSPTLYEETQVASCQNCGAAVAFDPAEHARTCPFCASPIVADTGPHRHIKPQAVLPFRLTEKEAHEALNRWLARLWFAPSGLHAYARPERKLDGIYLPFWAFDAETETVYTGERGEAYYVTRRINGKLQQVRQIRWKPVRGRVSRSFRDVLAPGSAAMPARLLRALEPWMLGELAPYRPEFLAGYRAQAYTREASEAHQDAVRRMEEIVREDVRRAIGGDEQRITSLQTTRRAEKVKHILLPVWLAAYRYRGKSYRFVVNGQTGKVWGERPWSVVKIAWAIALIVLFVALYVFLTDFR